MELRYTPKRTNPAILMRSAPDYAILELGDNHGQEATPGFRMPFSKLAENEDLLIALKLPTEFVNYYSRRRRGQTPSQSLVAYMRDMKAKITPEEKERFLEIAINNEPIEILAITPHLKKCLMALLG